MSAEGKRAGDEQPMMTWIPTGTRFARAENWVTLMFPSENDAIMFLEIMKDMQERVERVDDGDTES